MLLSKSQQVVPKVKHLGEMSPCVNCYIRRMQFIFVTSLELRTLVEFSHCKKMGNIKNLHSPFVKHLKLALLKVVFHPQGITYSLLIF